ncbi:MAG: T9SS type A sorting domain-containing protein [Bacteroidota bacterium]
MAQTSDQGYVVCTPIYTGNLFSFLMMKTTPAGDTMMTKHFDGFGTFFVPTTDGGFMITGGKSNRLLMVKTDSGFGTEWTKTFGEYNLRGEAVCKTSDNGYCFIAIHSYGPNTGNGFDVVKTNKNGDSQWTTSFIGGQRDFDVRSVILTPDDGFVICGTSRPFPTGASSAFLLKLNALGDSVWMKTYRRSNSSFGYEVLQAEKNGYLLVGIDHPSGSPDLLFLANTNEQGDTTWTKTYHCIYDAGVLDAIKIRGGGYIVAGSNIVGPLSTNVCLVRITENGDTLWTRSIGTMGNEGAMSIKQTMDDGFIVSGLVGLDNPSQSSSAYLVKTDSLGYYSPAGVDENEFTREIALFPNPVSAVLHVKFSGRINSLEILSMQGKSVYLARPVYTAASVYAVDLSGEAAGLYLLKITTDHAIVTRKFLKTNFSR